MPKRKGVAVKDWVRVDFDQLDGLFCLSADLERITGASRQTIVNYRKSGAITRNSENRYHFLTVMSELFTYLLKQRTRYGEEGSLEVNSEMSLNDQKIAKEIELLELKIDREKEKTIFVEDAARIAGDALSTVTTGNENAIAKIRGRFTNLDEKTMNEIESIIRSVCENVVVDDFYNDNED